MIEMLKSVCIFLIFATILSQLVPNKNFYKYVQLLVGLMMLAILLQDIQYYFGDDEAKTERQIKWNWLMDMEEQLDRGRPNEQVNQYMERVSEMFEEVEMLDDATTVERDASDEEN